MKASRTVLLIGLLMLAVGVIPLVGHHSFAAQYDRDQPIKLVGSLTKVEWTNPHVRLLVDSKDETGKVIHWQVELSGNMTRLSREGWKAESLKPGDAVTIDGFRARRIKYLMNADTVLKDGKRYFSGAGENPEYSAPR